MSDGLHARLEGRLEGRVPRAVRDRQLLDIAERLFTTHGFEGTSVEDVAKAAGVTRPVVYQHYGDKDGLYVACVRRARLEFDAALVAASAVGDGEPAARADVTAALRRCGETIFVWLRRDRRRAALLLATGTGPLVNRLAELRDGTVERVLHLVGDHAPGLDENSRRAAAHAIVGVAEELARWSQRDPEVPIEALTGYFVRFVAHGMVGAGAARPDGPRRPPGRTH